MNMKTESKSHIKEDFIYNNSLRALRQTQRTPREIGVTYG